MAFHRPSTLAVRPRGSKIVHATTEGSAMLGRTLCGRKCDAWLVATKAMTCQRCLDAIVRRRAQ